MKKQYKYILNSDASFASILKRKIEFKKVNLFLLFLILFSIFQISELKAQTIKIVRTDVDSSRSHFITASYVFGFDIYIDSLQKCNGASFELDWDHSDNVQFSQWKIGDIGSKSQAFVVDKVDQNLKIGKILAAVGTGLPLDSSDLINPRILHLEFVLLQNANNGDIVTFNFINPVASVKNDSVSEVISLNNSPYEFTVHSFIDMYPGDADNNGLVDATDFVNVMLYMGMGPLTKNVRTFKRTYPSIYWTAQKVLTWDVADATYTDCDGNGEITMSDLLIISYNLGLTHSSAGIVQSKEIKDDFPKIQNFPSKSKRIPINISEETKFLSSIFEINFSNDLIAKKFLGIEPADIFEQNNSYIYQKQEENILKFIIGSKNRMTNQKQNGTIAYLVFEEDTQINENDIIFKNSQAISENGEIFNLNSPTSVNFVNNDNSNNSFSDNQNSKFMKFQYQNNQLFIQLLDNDYLNTVQIFDLNGQLIRNLPLNSERNELDIEINGLAPKVYFVAIQTKAGKYFAEPLIFIK